MLNSKFDLYKSEWLELVFSERNKAYGAYELRQTYSNTVAKAMGIAFFSVSVLCAASFVFMSHPKMVKIIEVDNKAIVLPPPAAPVKKIEPPAAKPMKAEKPPKPIATIKDLPPKVVVDVQAENPPKNIDLVGKEIGQTNIKGEKSTGVELLKDPQTGTGTETAPANPNEVLTYADVMPEPVGGEEAWAKFLRKNLRFPAAAQEEGISGKVVISFVVERDGSISNIVVDRAAGHGFDEEAVRVLKLAKPWKPGKQNGQPVRVKYTIPVNFQLSE